MEGDAVPDKPKIQVVAKDQEQQDLLCISGPQLSMDSCLEQSLDEGSSGCTSEVVSECRDLFPETEVSCEHWLPGDTKIDMCVTICGYGA
jgi:hypothetical protein